MKESINYAVIFFFPSLFELALGEAFVRTENRNVRYCCRVTGLPLATAPPSAIDPNRESRHAHPHMLNRTTHATQHIYSFYFREAVTFGDASYVCYIVNLLI